MYRKERSIGPISTPHKTTSKRLIRQIVLHTHMCPLVRDVATPALLNRYLLFSFLCSEVSLLDKGPEVVIVVRPRCLMTPAAVRVALRWMPEAFNPPGSYFMALAAFAAEKPLMAVKVALGTLKIPIKKGVINLGDPSV